MRPDFGCDIWRHLTGAMDAPALERAKESVHDAMVTWEPRIEVGDVAVREIELAGSATVFRFMPLPEPLEEGTCVEVDIAFAERATATRAIAQFRCVVTDEPAFVVSSLPSHDEWWSRDLVQRVRGAW